MKKTKEYKTVGDWRIDAKKEGYSIPFAMCHGVTVAQKELGLNFPEVFELFVKNEIIIIEFNRFYIYNLKGYLGFKNK